MCTLRLFVFLVICQNNAQENTVIQVSRGNEWSDYTPTLIHKRTKIIANLGNGYQ